jgi:elongation factor P
MQAKDIKTGTVVVHEGNPVIIQGISVHSPSARGAATLYKFRARNVVTRNKVDLTLKGTESREGAALSRRNGQKLFYDAPPNHLVVK